MTDPSKTKVDALLRRWKALDTRQRAILWEIAPELVHALRELDESHGA
jgi:hypothetical protein